MRYFRTIGLSLGIATLISSCVLPVPHRRLHCYGTSATIISAKTGAPVQGAQISETQDGPPTAVSDANGKFEIPATYGWHGAYLIGPISYSILPHFDLPQLRPPLIISANGFETRHVPASGIFGTTPPSEGHEIIKLQPQN